MAKSPCPAQDDKKKVWEGGAAAHLQRSAAHRLEVPNATGSIAGLEPAVEPAVAVCRERAAVIEGAVAA